MLIVGHVKVLPIVVCVLPFRCVMAKYVPSLVRFLWAVLALLKHRPALPTPATSFYPPGVLMIYWRSISYPRHELCLIGTRHDCVRYRSLDLSPSPSLSACTPPKLQQGHSPFWMPRSGPPGRSNDQTVALILAGEIHYPRYIEPVAKAFIRELLHPDADSRLGCGGAAPRSVALPSSVAPQSSPSPLAETPEDAACSSTNVREKRAVGWQSVKQHGFFKDMDWEALLRGDMAAPVKPGALGRSMVGNFAREYTRQRAGWGGDQQELRDVSERDGLFRRELLGFDFVRD